MANETPTNTTLMRAITLLEEIATADRRITAADLDKRLDIPKPTIHRLLKQLEEQQLVMRDLDGRHLLPGARLHRIGIGTLANESLKAPRRLLLERLAKQVGETCNLTVLDGHQLFYYDRVETNWPVRIQLPTGSRLPLHCTASGKLFLALMPAHRRNAMLSALTLDAYTPFTLTSVPALQERLKEIARNSLSTDNEEFIQGMVAIAVPIYDQTGNIQATLAVHAPRLRHSIESLMEWAPLMRQIADELSETL